MREELNETQKKLKESTILLEQKKSEVTDLKLQNNEDNYFSHEKVIVIVHRLKVSLRNSLS